MAQNGMVASDDDNPNFVGAHNPDSRLAVRFYKKLIKDEFQTNREGRPIHKEVDFVHITVPGDSTFDIDTYVREEHKNRFPIHWARYQNAHGGDEKVVGTPLSQWTFISKALAEDLKYYKFNTVESIASASDAQIQSLGMAAGMNPFTLREKAQIFLKAAEGYAEVANREEEVNSLKAENDKLKADQQAMGDILVQLQQQVAELSKKKPGRPPKEDKES